MPCKAFSTSPTTKTPRPQRCGSSPPRWAATPACRASLRSTQPPRGSTTRPWSRPLGPSCPPTSTGSGHGSRDSRPRGSPGLPRPLPRLPPRGGHRARSGVPRAFKAGASGGPRAQAPGARSLATAGAVEPLDMEVALSLVPWGAQVLAPAAPPFTAPRSPTGDTSPDPCRVPSSRLAVQQGRGALGIVDPALPAELKAEGITE